ncbi:MAG: aldo/keto reductase [Planctomycetota bacterium]
MPTPIAELDRYRLLGRSGLRVSPLCLGTMTFGKNWGWGSDLDQSRAVFARYAEAGGNFIDTADLYTHGESEQYLGQFLNDPAFGGRDRFVLASKYTLNTPDRAKGDPNASGNHRKRMMTAVEASLKNLQTDYLDLYWLHIWDGTTPVDELMRAFDDLVRQGKVHYLAISDTPAWKVAQLNTYAEAHALSRFVATQVEYSLVERTVEREITPMCAELGLGVLPWSPLAGGVLTGKYTRADLEAQREGPSKPEGAERGAELTERKIDIVEALVAVAQEIGQSPAQVALNWLLRKPWVTSVILGARTVKQLDDNLGCLSFTLSDAHFERLEDASRITLGFPGDFIHNTPRVGVFATGGTRVDGRLQQPPAE